MRMALWAYSIICFRSPSFAAAPAAAMAKSISCRRYASISKLHMLSSAIAAIASLTLAIDFSAIALLKLAARASQSAAEAVAVRNSVAEIEIRSRLDTESMLGFSMGLLKQSRLDRIDDQAKATRQPALPRSWT